MLVTGPEDGLWLYVLKCFVIQVKKKKVAFQINNHFTNIWALTLMIELAASF